MLPAAILGTGFASHAIATKLSDLNIPYRVIDVAETLSIRHLAAQELVLSAFEMTRRVGGGIGVWGRKISLLDGPAHFSTNGLNREWEDVWSNLEAKNLLNPFGVFSINVPADPIAREFIQQIQQSGFSRNQHVKSPARGHLEKNKFGGLESQVLVGVDRKVRNGQTSYELSLTNTGTAKKIQRERFSAVFACSGPLGNAAIVHLATGVQSFKYGDHYSRFSSLIGFPRRVFLSHLGADSRAYFGFSTYSKAKVSETGCESLSLRFSDVSQLQLSSPHRVLPLPTRRFGLAQVFALHWTLDSGLAGGEISFRRGAGSSLEAYISGQLPESRLHNFQAVSSATEDLVADYGLQISPIPWGSSGEASTLDMNWRSARHPYGTVPVSAVRSPSTVSSSLELDGFDDFYVVGSSAFPDGRLDHPTALVAALAKLAVVHYARRHQRKNR